MVNTNFSGAYWTNQIAAIRKDPRQVSGALSGLQLMLTADAASLKKLNQLVWRIFTKGFGLTLQADAATFLVDKITGYAMDEAKMNEFLNYMAQNYTKISKGNRF